jgi:hypothetical protein
MSRAVEASAGASLGMSFLYGTKTVERSIEDQEEHPEYWQTLKSTPPTWGSIESDISCQEPGRGFSNASNLANGVGHVACNEQVEEGGPLPKRQRRMMQIRHAHFQTSSATLVLAYACVISCAHYLMSNCNFFCTIPHNKRHILYIGMDETT